MEPFYTLSGDILAYCGTDSIDFGTSGTRDVAVGWHIIMPSRVLKENSWVSRQLDHKNGEWYLVRWEIILGSSHCSVVIERGARPSRLEEQSMRPLPLDSYAPSRFWSVYDDVTSQRVRSMMLRMRLTFDPSSHPHS